MLIKVVNKFLRSMGNKLLKKSSKQNFPIEISQAEKKFITEILFPSQLSSNSVPLSMVSIERLWATISATKYIVENDIAGDLVECGVWRGGVAIAIAKTLQNLGSKKKLYLFDTFEGMTQPTSFDRQSSTKKSALKKFRKLQKDHHNEWCYSSLEDVKISFSKYNLMSNVKFIKGDVNETLKKTKNLPEKISLLRLDTDWYESTKIELEILYPLIEPKGILLIDDYGYWDGARKAVDEYFYSLDQRERPMQWVLDNTGRGYIK